MAIPDSLIVAHAGSIGGRKTAQRGAEYFRTNLVFVKAFSAHWTR
jgi:hypothetical protein